MVLGALIDAGVPLLSIRRALGSLTIDPEAVWTERVTRAGLSATKFCVRGEDIPQVDADDHGQAHRRGDDHGHGPAHRLTAEADETVHRQHGPHRTLAEIGALIDRSALSAGGRDRAKALFHRLGEAEAAVHGIPLDRVHLHEVGALDSIIDIVGAVHAMEAIGAQRVVSSPLNMGGGTVHSAHGHYPVPAPATALLLKGAPVYSGRQRAELITPTGALLITAYAESFGTVPAMRLETIGYGAGSRDLPDAPNVLRVLIGEASDHAAAQTVVVIEAEVDDMNPQIFGALMDRLYAAGALEVFYAPVQMKKNRPGTLMTIVAKPDQRSALIELVFRESTTIGVRYQEMARECLDREMVSIETSFGPVRFKVARRGHEVLNAQPEFDDLSELATQHQVPVKEVQSVALAAWLNHRSTNCE